MVSINTNTNQQAALQLLNANARELDSVQKRLATGLDIASAKDDGAIWGMAVHAKSDLASYETLSRARDHAIGLNDVTLAATEAVSDLVDRLNELALAAADNSLSDRQRATLDQQFQALKRQIDRTVGSATFDGINLLNSNGSNFLDYGPAVYEDATNAQSISWGSPLRTNQEPVAGDPIDLHFGFSGSGLQSEKIEGTVTYKLRYFDAGGTVDQVLASHTIPASTTVGPGLPIYDAAATATMPSIPTTATSVQIYAEYSGRYPSPDGEPVEDLVANGGPRSDFLAEGVPHLLTQWNERDWTAAPQAQVAHDLGAGVIRVVDDANPSVSVSGGTEPGSVISGKLRLDDLDLGIDAMGADATIYYDVFDASLGTWVNKASVAASSVAYGAASPPLDLAYSITLPNPAPNEDFSVGRLRAEVTTRHDGGATIGAGGPSVLPGSTVAVNGSGTTYPSSSFLEAAQLGARVYGTLQPQSTVPGETYDADTDIVLRWNDAGGWHEQVLGSKSLPGLSSDAPAPQSAFNFRIPDVASGASQAEIVARTAITHDPAGAASVENHEVQLRGWDGVTPSTSQTKSITIGQFSNTVAPLAKDPRRLEIATKIETLDSITGDSTPIREKDTRTVGLTGLQLEKTSVATVDQAAKALRALKAAKARVLAQARYYAGRSEAFASAKAMEDKIYDQTRINLGSLIDADLGKEAARLEAAKAKQGLLGQALSIANRLPAMVLSLFQTPRPVR